MKHKRKTNLNSALDLSTMANWISGGLTLATKKKYQIKNDQKSIYLQVNNNNQIIITPKDTNTGIITKQTKEGKNMMSSDPITYSTTGDCLSQITKLLSTNSSKDMREVDDLLFSVSASLRRAFTKSNPVSVNSSRKVIKLNSGNEFPTSNADEIPFEALSELKENLNETNIAWEEFPMVVFNAPNSPATCVLAFYDSEEKVLVGTTLDSINTGIVESCPYAFLEHFTESDANIFNDTEAVEDTDIIGKENQDLW